MYLKMERDVAMTRSVVEIEIILPLYKCTSAYRQLPNMFACVKMSLWSWLME